MIICLYIVVWGLLRKCVALFVHEGIAFPTKYTKGCKVSLSKENPRVSILYVPLKAANIQRLDRYELNVGYLRGPMDFTSLCFVEIN